MRQRNPLSWRCNKSGGLPHRVLFLNRGAGCLSSTEQGRPGQVRLRPKGELTGHACKIGGVGAGPMLSSQHGSGSWLLQTLHVQSLRRKLGGSWGAGLLWLALSPFSWQGRRPSRARESQSMTVCLCKFVSAALCNQLYTAANCTQGHFVLHASAARGCVGLCVAQRVGRVSDPNPNS